MIGERSSWETSEAKRTSRSMRVCTASAMPLNELARSARSGSASGAMRASRPPEAISLAAVDTRDNGSSRRRLVHHPSAAANSVVTPAPMAIAVAR